MPALIFFILIDGSFHQRSVEDLVREVELRSPSLCRPLALMNRTRLGDEDRSPDLV